MPDHVRNPIGLVGRTLREGGRAGRAAVLQAGLSLIAAPVDALLERHSADADPTPVVPVQPMIFVVGPPRSGTTIVAQTIARSLPVSHLTNLTAMFPRAPLAAARLLGVHPTSAAVTTISHYGRTAGLADHNDALPLWDRWIGRDRSALTIDMSLDQRRALTGFFAAYQEAYGAPIVAKNNNLMAHAHIIGSLLPTAVFVCMQRDPLPLAQSLLIARREIAGDERVPYGLHPDRTDVSDDVLVDVVRQIDFYNELAATQLRRLGDDRFRLLSYERFCDDPGEFLSTLATEVLGVQTADLDLDLEPLTTSAAQRVDHVEFDRLRALLGMARSCP